MNKNSIREKMLSHQQTIIAELSQRISSLHTMVDIDEESTHDPEDYSHQFESQELEHLIKVQLNKAKSGLQQLESIDFNPKNTITTGSIVVTDKVVFFIGFSMVPFKVGTDKIVSISINSPIYSLMANKVEGDQFTHAGNSFTVEKIY
ncbi:MAG: hypothetical protein ACJASQ_000193 [Crocinitomicaceae bacterium]|jgi:hypothetical protein